MQRTLHSIIDSIFASLLVSTIALYSFVRYLRQKFCHHSCRLVENRWLYWWRWVCLASHYELSVLSIVWEICCVQTIWDFVLTWLRPGSLLAIWLNNNSPRYVQFQWIHHILLTMPISNRFYFLIRFPLHFYHRKWTKPSVHWSRFQIAWAHGLPSSIRSSSPSHHLWDKWPSDLRPIWLAIMPTMR